MIKSITMQAPEYPELLKEIKKPPEKLYYIGDITLLQERCVAVVGSRSTTAYGRKMAVNIATRLAEMDIAVVSGMARGIDTCAHRGALNSNGKTITVLGSGPDICYPKENASIKSEIERNGLVISEYPPGFEPKKYCFPQRNRIISGISEMVIVVQARNDSGALITAELAEEYGREVCAVPGNIDSQYNMGTNKLIKDGARPLININDMAEYLGINAIDDETAKKMLSDTELKIYRILAQNGEMSVDELCQYFGKPPAYISSIVTVMELKGTVFTALGKIFIAKI